MNQQLKRAVMLLKSLIFHYHGLDEEEEILLEEAAKKYNSHEELLWANSFIAEDYISAFERSRKFLREAFGAEEDEIKLQHLKEVWIENYDKGYVTEMETTAMVNLSKDWHVEPQFLSYINE